MKFRSLAALVAAASLSLPSIVPALAQAPEYDSRDPSVYRIATPPADPWPFAESDLPLDPQYRVGVLANGLRYIIRPNGTPAGQGLVYFWIDAGSMGENDDQAGYAHFFEHMAFNGSTNVPEGEMVRLLEREGLAFGADTNASTGFDRTLFTLNLPRNDDGLLDTALFLMREVAGNVTIAPDAVEREKGVVLSELRTRDTYQQRNTLDNIAFLYPGSLLARRWVSGTPESIAAATAEQVRDYYGRWYRPDNTALIVIGDFDPDTVERMIAEHFSDWQPAAGASAPTGGPVDFDLQGKTDIFLDPALSEAIAVTRHGPWIDRPDTVATRQERVLRQIGYGIVNRRLQRLSRSEDPPFRAAQLSTDEVFRAARSTTLNIQAAEGEWQRGLAAAQEEYRQAMEFGFGAGEVAEQVAALRSAIEANAAGAETRNNNDFVTGAITLLEDGQVPTTPQTALERFNDFADTITPEAVLAALQADIVPLDNPLLRFTGRTAPEGGAEAIRAAWDEGMTSPLEARADTAALEFAYSDFGPAGTIASDTVEPQLGIRTVTFANGVKLNLKQTDLAEDRVTVQINVDGGEMLDTKEDPLASDMFSYFTTGGLGQHSLDDLVSIFAGKQVGLSASAEDDTFRFTATTTPGDLDMQLELLAAAISDPGYRTAGEEQYRRNVINWFARQKATPESVLSTSQGTIISDGDPRFSLQPEEDYLALTFARLKAAIGDRLDHGAMEVALVGDFDEQAAIDMVARTLGALPAREADFRSYANNRQRSFTAERGVRVLHHQGEANQALMAIYWPTRDDSDLKETIDLEMLERIARIKLTDTLREELGQTYSPGVSATQSRAYPGWGTFLIQAEVDTSDVEAARSAIVATVESLRNEPVDEDTLLRARAPQLEAYDNQLKSNNGWMALVDRAQTEPDRIARFLEGKALLEAVTPADIQAMAQRYLDPDQRLEINVLPEESE